MDTRVNYTMVGLFVVVLTAALVFSIIWLSAGVSFVDSSIYRVYMTESVTGLNVDSQVEYNGVEVGRIAAIRLSRRNPNMVVLDLRIQNGTPITRGTVATLGARGLTGITYLTLQDKGTDLTPLTALPGQRYPVIKTSPSLLVRIDNAIATMYDTSLSLKKLLDDENLLAFKETLINMRQITSNLASQTNKFNDIIDNAAIASRRISPLLQSSESMMKMLEMQTIPVFNRTLNNLDEISQNLSEISTDLRKNPAVLLRGKAQAPLGPGEK
jgi:phospholipid/cholesterol/gamma-HCH transport system substrate-binding protein